MSSGSANDGGQKVRMTDIYQSPSNRLRFETLLNSLSEGCINLAVLSDQDRVLDDYSRLFEERLRAKGESHIEWCSSISSERLVQKFNEILSEIALDQASKEDKQHAPRRFLLFRDSILIQDFELQLLARLVNGCRAGNIRVILFINSAGNYTRKIDAFGNNLLKWEVETETDEAKQKLTDWVATAPVSEPDPPTLYDEVMPAAKRQSWRTNASRAGWVLLVLLMCKNLAPEESELLKKYLLRGTPVTAAPDEAASVAAVVTVTVASEPVPDKKTDEKADEKLDVKSDANSDEAWVNQLLANAYVVQLAAMDTQDEMRSFQRSNAAYAKTRIMRTRHKDTAKHYFILVAGPFHSKAQANAFMQSSPLLAKGWLRSSKSMKAQFEKS
jgi:septal ring-binding cell division protein DamX